MKETFRNVERAGRRFAILALVILLLGSISSVTPLRAAGKSQGPTDPQEMETFFNGVMAAHLRAFHIPGATLAVVKDGEVFFAKGYGYADLETRRPVDPERTLFRPGSVSKLFVWTAVMQLVEQDQLDLDVDVNTYLDFEIPDTYPQPITLAHLMTHTPGFEDVGQGLFKLSAEDVRSLDVYLRTYLPARVFPPGEVVAYSNYGSALAAYVVERVSGVPFAEYVERHIFEPLEMTHSTFRQPLPAHLAPDRARGYNYVDGAYVDGGFEFVQAYPAGSLSSTATDMARFMIAHLQEGRYWEQRILQAETAREMHRQHYTSHPLQDGLAYGFMETTANGQRLIQHGGDTFLFHSGLFLLPEQNVGFFVSHNGTSGHQATEAFLEVFMDHYYPVEPSPRPQPSADAVQRAQPFVGEYHTSRRNFSTLEKLLALMQPLRVGVNDEGYLLVTAQGETSQLVEAAPGIYESRLAEEEETLIFHADEDGEVKMLPPGPMVFTKAPWYATTTFTGLLVGGGLLLYVGTLVGWPLAFFVARRRDQKRPRLAIAARWTAALFGLLTLFFLAGFVGMMSDVDPAYGVPRLFFGLPPAMDGLLRLPPVLGALTAGMLVFTALAWWKGYWRLGGRVHYTLLTLTALALLWTTAYWNLL